MYYDGAYAPFAEPYAQSGTADLSFIGMNQDTVSGLYDFPAREYSITGRWVSPDPAGLAAVDPTNPQSWNRYSYVLNDPLDLVDPTGLCPNDNSWGSYLCQLAQSLGSTTFYGNWDPLQALETASAQIGDVSATLAGVPLGDTQTLYADFSVLDLLGNSSWWGTFGSTFLNGILYGTRKPGESLKACIARNADETTGGVSSKVTNSAFAAVATVAAAGGIFSQISTQTPWGGSAATITNAVAAATGQGAGPLGQTAAGTIGGYIVRSLGGSRLAMRIGAKAATGLSEGAMAAAATLTGASIGLVGGSYFNCSGGLSGETF